MYNERERLMHHQQLLAPESAAADLQLLADLSPKHPQLDEFRLSPTRQHDTILLELLKVASRDDIVMNRLRFNARKTNEPEPAPVPGVEPKPVPSPKAAKKKAASASKKKKNTPT